MSHMAVENEIKLCVESFDKIRDDLSRIGAEYVSVVNERNILYDNDPGNLRNEDVGFRLRYEEDRDKRHVMSIITIKGPKMSGATKKRQEFEVTARDFNRANDMILMLGFRRALIYEKIRERWKVGDLEICLDILPFGLYVEIEGLEKEIMAVSRRLGFLKSDFITSNYFDIARDKGIVGDIVF